MDYEVGQRDALHAANELAEQRNVLAAARYAGTQDDHDDDQDSDPLGRHTWHDEFPLTEAGDAEHFARMNGETVRFDHRQSRWLLFDAHRWAQQSDGEITRLALESIRARQTSAIGNADRLKWMVKGESRARLSNGLDIAQKLRPLTDAGDRWDRDPELLGVANGVVDLRTGTLRDGRPDDRITMQSPVAYDPQATCPQWEAFLASVFDPTLVDYIRRAVGYSLTGDCREECLFFCYGEGSNGKSTFLKTLAHVSGEYANDLPFTSFDMEKKASVPNDLAKLVGRRFVTASETGENTRLNESRIKAVTGRDPVTARFLYGEFFTFDPMFKLWLAANHKPVVRDDSMGFWRRLHLIPFTRSFLTKPDTMLKDRLMGEAAGILAWAVRGCLEWRDGGLNPPQVVKDATEAYRLESDPLTPFYEACCDLDPRATVRASVLFERYQQWCADPRRVSPDQRLTLTAFGKHIKTRFASGGARHVVYSGIGIRGPIPK